MEFGSLADIDPAYPESWENKLFLTLDIDWADDPVFEYVLNLLMAAQVPATLFTTHETYLNRVIDSQPQLDLGIHPNFNPLLMGVEEQGVSLKEVLDRYMAIVPGAVSMRSHSLTHSGIFFPHLQKCGIKHYSNTYVPVQTGTLLKPWRWPETDINVLPYNWADDYNLSLNVSWNDIPAPNPAGLNILSFHIIHIFLNTEDYGRYLAAKPFAKDFDRLESHRNKNGHGVGTFFKKLLDGTFI